MRFSRHPGHIRMMGRSSRVTMLSCARAQHAAGFSRGYQAGLIPVYGRGSRGTAKPSASDPEPKFITLWCTPKRATMVTVVHLSRDSHPNKCCGA